MTNITELPIWLDCPWQLKIPSWIDIRRGKVEGQERIVLWNEEYQIACDALAEGFKESSLAPMINNIGCTIFEREHPGELGGVPGKVSLPRRMAMAVVTQGYPDQADLKLHQRLKELTTIPAGIAVAVS